MCDNMILLDIRNGIVHTDCSCVLIRKCEVVLKSRHIAEEQNTTLILLVTRRNPLMADLVNFESYSCSWYNDLLNGVHIHEDPLIPVRVRPGITKKHTIESIHEVVSVKREKNSE